MIEAPSPNAVATSATAKAIAILSMVIALLIIELSLRQSSLKAKAYLGYLNAFSYCTLVLAGIGLCIAT